METMVLLACPNQALWRCYTRMTFKDVHFSYLSRKMILLPLTCWFCGFVTDLSKSTGAISFFRERPENVDLVIKISLQQQKFFKPNGVSNGLFVF
jgi:hypothetical protein